MKLKDIILREISQTQKISVSVCLSSSIFAFYSASATHLKREQWKERVKRKYKKEIGERNKIKNKNNEIEKEVQGRGCHYLCHGSSEHFSFIFLD